MKSVLFLAAFVTGAAASMGLGGGMILILALSFFSGFTQLESQGINLMFFLPIAFVSLVMHTKNGLVRWRMIIPSVVWGISAAVLGSIFAGDIGNEGITKAFAAFVTIAGIRELSIKNGTS